MQKVIMLPRLAGLKQAIFCKRLISFNETFAPVGGKAKGKVSSRLECYGMNPSRKDLRKMSPVLSFSFYARIEIPIILYFGATIALVKIRIGFFMSP